MLQPNEDIITGGDDEEAQSSLLCVWLETLTNHLP